jgi:hypothetical protein
MFANFTTLKSRLLYWLNLRDSNSEVNQKSIRVRKKEFRRFGKPVIDNLRYALTSISLCRDKSAGGFFSIDVETLSSLFIFFNRRHIHTCAPYKERRRRKRRLQSHADSGLGQSPTNWEAIGFQSQWSVIAWFTIFDSSHRVCVFEIKMIFNYKKRLSVHSQSLFQMRLIIIITLQLRLLARGHAY